MNDRALLYLTVAVKLAPRCPSLDAPPNGLVAVTSRGGVQVASYGCNAGYQVFGNLTRQCPVERGTWSDTQPYCQGEWEWFPGSYLLPAPPLPSLSASPLSCGTPPAPRVSSSSAWVEADSSGTPIVTYMYSCNGLFNISARLSCQNGSWRGNPPIYNSECKQLLMTSVICTKQNRCLYNW